MFDFAWSEIALIGVVALIAIGPKDMPVAIKAVSDTVKKLRRMAGEFQGHVDEMIREADLGDVKSSFDELRSLNPKAMVQRAIDPDNTMRSAFADPFREHPVRPVMTPLDQAHAVPAHPATTIAAPDPALPAFIPPSATAPAAVPASAAPAFIPPASVAPASVVEASAAPAYAAPASAAPASATPDHVAPASAAPDHAGQG